MSTVSSLPPSASAYPEGSGSLTFLSAKQPLAPRGARRRSQRLEGRRPARRWTAWRAYLAGRPAPETDPHHPSGKKPTPLAWGLTAAEGEAFDSWRRGLGKKQATGRGVARLARRAPDRQTALEAVAWAAALPTLAKTHEADLWWRLTETLLRLVDEATAAAAPEAPETEATVVHNLIAGELAWVLATRLPELRPAHELAGDARKLLSQAVESLTDGEGLADRAAVDRRPLARGAAAHRLLDALPDARR